MRYSKTTVDVPRTLIEVAAISRERRAWNWANEIRHQWFCSKKYGLKASRLHAWRRPGPSSLHAGYRPSAFVHSMQPVDGTRSIAPKIKCTSTGWPFGPAPGVLIPCTFIDSGGDRWSTI